MWSCCCKDALLKRLKNHESISSLDDEVLSKVLKLSIKLHFCAETALNVDFWVCKAPLALHCLHSSARAQTVNAEVGYKRDSVIILRFWAGLLFSH